MNNLDELHNMDIHLRLLELDIQLKASDARMAAKGYKYDKVAERYIFTK